MVSIQPFGECADVMKMGGENRNEITREEPPVIRVRKRGLRSEVAKLREKAIDQLVDEATARGDCVDRFYWMLVYDLEMAPMTSNLRQLKELGLEIPPPETLDDRGVHGKLWEILETLGDLGVFLLRTDGFSDRDLYAKLFHEILVEPVRDLPPTEGVSEFIDLLGATKQPGESGKDVVKVIDRDRFLPKPDVEPTEISIEK